MATDALARWNRRLDSFAAQNLTIYSITRTVQAIVPSQASYTIGPSGNINIVRPVFIDHVNFIDTATTPDTEYPLADPLTEQEWQQITLKDLTAPFPQSVYYNPTYPLGTLYLWPIPTGATLQLVVYAWTALTQIPLLSTVVDLPPGYSEMLVQDLALALCVPYDKNPHPMLVRGAAEAMATVKRANSRVRTLSFEDVTGNNGGVWNIRVGP